jgi:hypothetical protein
VLVGARAQDAQSGIGSIELTLDTSVTCGDDQLATHTQSASTTHTDAPTGASLPITLNGFQTLKGVDIRHLCPASQLLEVVVVASATAVNGLGERVATPTLTLTFDGGPDKLRFALLNVNHPALSSDDGADVGQLVPDSDPPQRKVEVWSALDLWRSGGW